MPDQTTYSATFHKPYLEDMLAILKMDKHYDKAEGNYLFTSEENGATKVLDLAGGFGSTLLGHNHPELIQTIKNLYENNNCTHHQLSKKVRLNTLATEVNRYLERETGQNYTIVALNTGAEAVEAAIKHALLTFELKIEQIKQDLNKVFRQIEELAYQKGQNGRITTALDNCSTVEELRAYVKELNRPLFELEQLRILATNKSFHGKTLGALSITSNPDFRDPFIRNSPFKTIFLDINEELTAEIFEQNRFEIHIPRIGRDETISLKKIEINTIAAIVLEPIIGEGGIHPLPEKMVRDIRKEATNYNIPLIFDEIQSGCFRTGTFLASTAYGVKGDYYLLGKSLGGGLSKISLVCIEQKQYIPEFDLLHTSTFAEDDISTEIAIKSLEILNNNQTRIKELGHRLFEGLKSVKAKYPQVIEEIRGKGLMMGISFRDFSSSRSYGIQGISRSKYFGYVLAAYLLNEFQIRVSVTLSDSHTLRILPSVYLSEADISLVLEAFDRLCHILECRDFYSLTSFLLPEEQQRLRDVQEFERRDIPMDTYEDCVDEVGFLLHYVDEDTIKANLPSLNVLSTDVILELIQRLSPFSEPVIIGRNKIRNELGQQVGITFIGLSFTARMVSDSMRRSFSELKTYQAKCDKAISLLAKRGIRKIGLGQYNSIIMQNGRAVSHPEVRVTTGNGFTVYSAYKIAKELLLRRSGQNTTVGIVGAGGNIGKILSELLLPYANELILLGRAKSDSSKLTMQAEKLRGLSTNQDSVTAKYTQSANSLNRGNKYETVLSHHVTGSSPYPYTNGNQDYEGCIITTGTDPSDLKSCDLVMVATSDPSPFLKMEHFKRGAVICDISVPLNCEKELLVSENHFVIQGGVLKLPNSETLCPIGLSLDKGKVFACMSETLLMGYESGHASYSFGEITREAVLDLGERLKKIGFIPSIEKKL